MGKGVHNNWIAEGWLLGAGVLGLVYVGVIAANFTRIGAGISRDYPIQEAITGTVISASFVPGKSGLLLYPAHCDMKLAAAQADAPELEVLVYAGLKDNAGIESICSGLQIGDQLDIQMAWSYAKKADAHIYFTDTDNILK